MLQMNMTSKGRRPKIIKSGLSQQPLIGLYPNFKPLHSKKDIEGGDQIFIFISQTKRERKIVGLCSQACPIKLHGI